MTEEEKKSLKSFYFGRKNARSRKKKHHLMPLTQILKKKEVKKHTTEIFTMKPS